jgi:uncharacterized protein YbgA (DUF1722 family)/uncharacterized protein YbbK (DUF523 family)
MSTVPPSDRAGSAAAGPRWRAPPGPLRVGVSRCLLGEEVRYDGQHKRDRFLTDVLGPLVEWVPVCPEVELGLGIPREAMHLQRGPRGAPPRLVTIQTGRDLTDRMTRYAQRRVRALEGEGLCGYVLKKSSPSCGLHRVKLHPAAGGTPAHTGRGLFAGPLVEQFPLLPVEEEGRLEDPGLRDSFIERLFAYRRLRALFDARWTRGELVAFHTAHKMSLLAHSTTAYRALGRLVAGAKGQRPPALGQAYQTGFMAALSKPATRGRHSNVLQHMAGHLNERLDAASRAELAASIEDHHRGLLPLIVPLTLLRHHVRVHAVAYLAGQIYLEPTPRELMLRNQV